MASVTGGEDTVPLDKLLVDLKLSEPETDYDHMKE